MLPKRVAETLVADQGHRVQSFSANVNALSVTCTHTIPFFRVFQRSPHTVIAPYVATVFGRQDESDSAISADISLLVVGYILLAAYGLIVLAKNHPVASASWLAVASIGSILLAVVCSFGFSSAIGIKFSLVEQVGELLLACSCCAFGGYALRSSLRCFREERRVWQTWKSHAYRDLAVSSGMAYSGTSGNCITPKTQPTQFENIVVTS